MGFKPSLHPRDLIGRFKNKKGGPQEPSKNPIKQAKKAGAKALGLGRKRTAGSKAKQRTKLVDTELVGKKVF